MLQAPPKKEEIPKFFPETVLEERILKEYELQDHTGKHTVELRDIPTVIRSLGCCPTEAEIEEVIEKTQYKDPTPTPTSIAVCPAVNFIPFMVKAMTNHRYYPSNAEELLAAFRYFDPEGRGYITKEKFTQLMMEEGEPFQQEEFERIMQTALDPVTNTIVYEYYVNQLLIIPYDIYNIADELEAERKRIEEEEKAKRRRLVG